MILQQLWKLKLGAELKVVPSHWGHWGGTWIGIHGLALVNSVLNGYSVFWYFQTYVVFYMCYLSYGL